MAAPEKRGPSVADFIFNWLVVVLVLSGLLALAVSFSIPVDWLEGFVRRFVQELAIVILAVSTVSLLYEKLLGQKYLQDFLKILQGLFEEGESNAAACVHLGIMEIFPKRNKFEDKYPIANWTSMLGSGSTFRIVAKTLFGIMTKVEAIQQAIKLGARVEFCIMDPKNLAPSAEKIVGLEKSDIKSAISVFTKQIGAWVRKEKPSGSVELRYHRLPLSDSYTVVRALTLNVAVWDLHFGRSTANKTILCLDPEKPLSKDLTARYDLIWEDAEENTIFKYENEQVTVDKLGGQF